MSASALSLGSYFAARRFMVNWRSKDTTEVAGAIAFRVAALHGLIISLIFAGEVQSHQTLRFELIDEATALSEMHADLHYLGTTDATKVRSGLEAYLKVAAGPEWSALAGEEGDYTNGWSAFHSLKRSVVEIDATNDLQSEARTRLLVRLDIISKARHGRWSKRSLYLPPVFWISAFAGLMIVSICFSVYDPDWGTVFLIVLYGTYTGLVLSVIFALSTPFSAPVSLQPDVLVDSTPH